MFEQIRNLLPDRINDLGLRRQVDGATVCNLWRKHAAKFFWSSVLDAHEPISFRDGVLNVSVVNPIIAGEIRYKERQILLAINDELGKVLVQAVRYR